jgi:hypothetical protein
MMRHRGELPPNTPEQTAAYETMGKAILAGTARIPSGIPTNDRLAPPADVPEAAIDEFIALARKFESYDGPFPIHPLFGRLTPEEWRQFNLLHAAHHLGHLVPRTA